MRDFHNFDAWVKAHRVTLAIYKLTDSFPHTESFGLVISMRRSAANMTMKIAEACGRDDGEPYASGLRQARAFAMELEYQLLLCHDLELIDDGTHNQLTEQVIEVRRMLSPVIRRHSQPTV